MMDAANLALDRMAGMLAGGNAVVLVGRAMTELRVELSSHDKQYKNIIETSTQLGTDYVHIDNDTVSIIKTEEENLRRLLEVTDEVKQDSVMAVQELQSFFQSFEQRLQNSLWQLEQKKSRVEDVHRGVGEVIVEAVLADSKAEDHERLVSAAPEIGGAGGGLAGAGMAGLTAAQVISKFLPALGPPGVVAGITISALSGLGLGALSGMYTGKTVSKFFKHRVEKFQKLIDLLLPIQEALIERIEDLTEVISLLSALVVSIRDIIDHQEDPSFLEYELKHFLNTSSKAREQNNRFITKKAGGNMLLSTEFANKSENCSHACGSSKP